MSNGGTPNLEPLFRKTLEEFKAKVRRRDQKAFEAATVQDLKQLILDIQWRQHAQRRQRNLKRLEPYIEALEQFGKVVEVFCNSSIFVPFVWGPMKLLLQIANTYTSAFDELLNLYGEIGETLPLLSQYEDRFRNESHMAEVLPLIYNDILEAHKLALQYFTGTMWKQLFQATWKTHRSRFDGVLGLLRRHRQLVESQASLAQMMEFRTAHQAITATRDQQRRQHVHMWLKSTSMENEQRKLLRVRMASPLSGSWILSNETFKDWYNPRYAALPTLLWLNGRPGAGKSVLASVVVEAVSSLNPKPTVLYFYCKHGDTGRDNFIAIARSLLAQLLQQNTLILDYLHFEANSGGEAFLESQERTEKLLAGALDQCDLTYIILDGLDECCSREERKHIVTWFKDLVEEQSNQVAESAQFESEDAHRRDPDRIRCLFVSRVDSARKDFADLATISISAHDTEHDIEEYGKIQSRKLQEKFELADDDCDIIATSVSASAEGLFLLAKLVWEDLLGQVSRDALHRELESFPSSKNLTTMYKRVFEVIMNKKTDRERDDILDLLGWLVHAKRPMKTHELQALKSMDADQRIIDLSRHRYRIDLQDIGESFIEERDGTIDFVHLTAKEFLLDRFLDPEFAAMHKSQFDDLQFTLLCINYLNFPIFKKPYAKQGVVEGEYGLTDYATLYWVRHLESGLQLLKTKPDLLERKATMVDELQESFETLLDSHWNSATVRFKVAERTMTSLQVFKDSDRIEDMQQAVASTRKQLKHFGELRTTECVLDLAQVVQEVRTEIEAFAAKMEALGKSSEFSDLYGSNIYKCPRFSCKHFTEGFATAELRQQHMDRHTNPFRCQDEHCYGFQIGYADHKRLKKHNDDTHPESSAQEERFPSQAEIERSMRPPTPPAPPVPEPVVIEEPESEPEEEPRATAVHRTLIAQPDQARQKRVRREYQCEHCGKLFKKKFNWESHLAVHGGQSFTCSQCDATFARRSDLTRHERQHLEVRPFVCGNVLPNGQRSWGCGTRFARADILRSHHRSLKGQRCVAQRDALG